MTCRIERLIGRRVWDSRGRPTVEVELRAKGGSIGRGIAPAGASRGSKEAIDLRDKGPEFGGFGVDSALANVNREISAAIIGMDASDQGAIDHILIELDGTLDKSRLGGNAIVATSMASLNLAAACAGIPLWQYLASGNRVRLPLPQVQIFGGGAHAGTRIDIQDLMVIPVGAHSFDQAMAWVAEVYRAAGNLLAGMNRLAGVADEGGWWPAFESNEEALQVLTRSIEKAGFTHDQVAIALDIAASQLGSAGHYHLKLDQREHNTAEWADVILGWIRRYPIVSIEDPFSEDDSEGVQTLTRSVGDSVQIVGDDSLVTNAARIIEAAAQKHGNAALLKPNQAGTITETFAALEAALGVGFGTIVSARSGETEDVSIAHLAVGWNAGQLKVGSFARSERMAKWNECLRIEAQMGPNAAFAGRAVLPAGNTRVSQVS